MSLLGLAAVLVSIGLAGPAQVPAPAPAATTPQALRPLSRLAEQAVTARVRAWWTARASHDHQRMYNLFEPAYRKRVAFPDFVKESAVRSRFDIADPKVESVVPEAADRVRVKVNIETHPPALPVGRVTAEEVWVRVAGAWYKVHQDVTLPFPTTR